MKVEHIVWKEWNYTDKNVYGILEIEVHWPDIGNEIIVMEGTYINKFGRGKFVNSFVTIDENTQDVSGVTLRRIGQIVS